MRLARWMSGCSALLAALALSACGGGGSYGGGGTSATTTTNTTTSTSTSATTTTAVSAYAATALVTDTGTAANPYHGTSVDAHLVNPWGVAFNPAAFVWVNNAGSNTSTLYDGNGVPQSLVVAIPPGSAGSAAPTGIVYNATSGFQVVKGALRGASLFIFAGEAGTISAWSPDVDLNNAVTMADDGAAGAMYTGLAIATLGTSPMLYAADFRHGSVNVFNASFARATVTGGFADPQLPAGYAPFGLQAIGGVIYVAYARPDATGRTPAAGAGAGIVDTFTPDGVLVKRLIAAGGALNAPWGMAMAPANFGRFSGALLVANGGDGHINAFDPGSGALLGTLDDSSGAAITFDGLHGIAFGNDLNSQPSNTLFFAAGPTAGTHGVYGRIDSR